MSTRRPLLGTFSLKQAWPWLGLMLILAGLPYLIAWIQTPPDQTFLASLINPDDTSVYLAAMRQGSEGYWLFRFNFSPESLPPSLMHAHYMLVGRLAAWTGGSFILWFHAFRLAAGLFTLLSLLFWVRTVFPGNSRLQKTVWLLILFGAGFGWLATILFSIDFRQAPDIGRPEWGVLMPLLNTPHFALGLGLEVSFLACLIRMRRSGRGWLWALLGSLAGIGLGFVYTFNVAAVGLITGIYLLAIALARRRVPWHDWLKGAIVLAPLVPFVFYYGYWIRRDPLWDAVQFANNVVAPPSPLSLVIGFGLVGGLALVGVRSWARHGFELLVPIWAIVNVLVIYAPVPFSGRFMLGLTVPVATLAGSGLEDHVLPWLSSRQSFARWHRLSPTPYDTIRRLFLILTVPSTMMVVLFLMATPRARPDFPLFLPTADLEAAQWLAQHGDPDALILAHYPVGNVLPRLTGMRVFVGQPFLTVEFEEKIQLLQTFWKEETPNSWREAFLREWEVDYVFAGRYERAVMSGEVRPPGQIIYRDDGVIIYAVGEIVANEG